jgi:predicted transcriptional regulator
VKRFTVEIADAAFAKLAELAEKEKRTPKAQASWLLEQILAEAQGLTEEDPEFWIGGGAEERESE